MEGSKIDLLLCKLFSMPFSSKATPRASTYFVTCLRSAALFQLFPASHLLRIFRSLISPFLPLSLFPLGIKAGFNRYPFSLPTFRAAPGQCLQLPASPHLPTAPLPSAYLRSLTYLNEVRKPTSCLESPLADLLSRFEMHRTRKEDKRQKSNAKPLKPLLRHHQTLALLLTVSLTAISAGFLCINVSWCNVLALSCSNSLVLSAFIA